MKNFAAIMVLTIIALGVGYVVGYKSGVADYSYLDYVANSLNKIHELEYCNKQEESSKCLKGFSELNVSQALALHVEKGESLSPLAEYALSGLYELKDRALDTSIKYYVEHNMVLCPEISVSFEPYVSECKQRESKVNSLIVGHSNKSLKDAP